MRVQEHHERAAAIAGATPDWKSRTVLECDWRCGKVERRRQRRAARAARAEARALAKAANEAIVRSADEERARILRMEKRRAMKEARLRRSRRTRNGHVEESGTWLSFLLSREERPMVVLASVLVAIASYLAMLTVRGSRM